jgi:acyl-CoA synthetase (AMP-forming)/AMP-acid ligase II
MTCRVFDVFASAVKKWPNRPLLNVLPETAEIYKIPTGEVSYAVVANRVSELMTAYGEAGYGAGHRILLLLENRPAFFLHWLALNGLGCSVVPVNPDLRATELAYLVSHSAPSGAVCIASRAKGLLKIAPTLPVFRPDDAIMPPKGAPSAAMGEAAMLYTSGTTGNPKGCVLTNEYFTLSGEWYKNAGGLCAITQDFERMITPLPVFHMNAMACSFMAMITVGGCLTVLDRFHPKTWWQSVRDSRATCLHYLGVMPSMLMGAQPDGRDREHWVRFGFGAGIDPKLHEPFETRFGIPLVEAWAMTETGCVNAIAANRLPRLVGQSCLGSPSPDIEVRLVDDADQDVGVGVAGELLIRAAGDNPKRGFFDHYYKDPQATADAWDGGWFHTGDLVKRDAEDRFFFVDRKKNIIRRSGENIAAVEVESVLMRHPDVNAAAVTSVPDALRGDEVFAVMIVDQPSPAKAVEIGRWCLDQMAYFKIPGYIHFGVQLPLTATQKIRRGVLKTLAVELLEHPDTHHMVHLKKQQVA